MKYTIDRKAEDTEIVKYIDTCKININDSTQNLASKIKFLINEMGWKNLRVGTETGGSSFKSIYECSPERVSAVVRNTYNDAKKRLSTRAVQYDYTQLEFNLEKDIALNEKKRLEALANQNAVDYYNQCEILGIEPEDTYLYEQGLGEIKYQEILKG